jgi:hypothetical protein
MPSFSPDDDVVYTFICPNVDVIFGYVPDEVQAMRQISGLLGENRLCSLMSLKISRASVSAPMPGCWFTSSASR